ncbi:MAG: hypothetical protein K0S58_139 [Nitrospira sp.]|nr:hypothetical protein [Nitrospira sp.]
MFGAQRGRLVSTDDRHEPGVQQPDLSEEGSLIPVDMLVSNLPTFKLHDDDGWQFNRLAGWRNPWQHELQRHIIA